jgi:hypothetical protein
MVWKTFFSGMNVEFKMVDFLKEKLSDFRELRLHIKK